MKISQKRLSISAIAGLLILASILLSACGAPAAPAATETPATEQPLVPTVEATPTEATPAEPTMEVEQKSELGEVIFEDNFSDQSNNWDFSSNENSESIIEDGKLKVRVINNDKFTHIKPPVDAAEVDLSVDAEFTDGVSMQYGFLCHYKDGDNYLRAVVSTKGSYSIVKKMNAEFATLVDWNPSSTIDQGTGMVNRLRLVCTEGHVSLFINDALAADVMDTSLSGGSYRLVAGWPKSDTDNTVPVSVSFSNLVVRKPLAWEPSSDLLFSDSFDNNDNAWGLFEKDDFTVQIKDGQKVMRIETPDYYVYNRIPVQLTNVDMAFDVILQEGTPANTGFGAMCRWTDKDNYYEFRMNGDGLYRAAKRVKGNWETLIDWSASTAVKPGVGETNRIRVVCAGSNLELYANEQPVIKINDGSLTSGGSSIIANSFEVDDAPVTVAFDNLEVKYPLDISSEIQTSNLPLFEDFKNNNNGWSLTKDDDGSVEIVDGVMLIKIAKENLRYWSVPELTASNVDMTIGTFIVEGTPSNTGFGAVCRYTDENNYYDFIISGDGYFLLGKSVNGTWEALVDWTATTAIQQGALVPNAIRVVCSGSSLELYANDQLLAKTTDESLTTGGFGLFTERWNDDNVPIAVGFDTLDVKEP
ncbi:MAG: hypothetical protein AB9891_16350 [Anaerolineaceae bacterium]